MDPIENEYSEAELIDLFAKLFPKGFAGPDVLRDVAPEGWTKSPLFALTHPSPQQRYKEALRTHRNLASLKRRDDAPPPPPEPTLEEFTAEPDDDDSFEQDEEVSRVIGMAIWDVFSDSHEVRDAEGREVSLGSFRSSGGFLADRLNEQVKAGLVKGPAVTAAERSALVHEQMRKLMPEMNNDLLFQFMQEQQTGPYDYMDFYMGSGMISGRADMTPIYRMIFTRLKALDLDWKYTFPRLHVVDMRPLGEALKAKKAEESGEPDWLNYSPDAEFAKEEANREKDREIAEMRESLDEGYRESVEEALTQEPPLVVRVYAAVFGGWPNGWPPDSEA